MPSASSSASLHYPPIPAGTVLKCRFYQIVGGVLSPLLSNLVLDDLDKELTQRGHRFCRYAGDCNVYVRSRRAGERVMTSVSRFLVGKLRLKVNDTRANKF